MENCKPIHQCLACGGDNLYRHLDLTDQPLANSFRSTESTEGEPRYPLAINRCEDCSHLQLTHAVNPELIYRHYLYVSGTSRTQLEYMDWYAHWVREQFDYWTDSVLDIGCNDGSQLDAFARLGYRTWGVDPAENLYPVSSAKHSVICGFWDVDTAEKLGREFEIITVQNAFAHVPDPLSYLELAKQYLRLDGKIFISTSQADMVLNGEFDTIYHEHISFYNAESMRRLARRAGLYLVDVVKTPIHGTSYVFVLAKQPLNQHRVQNILAMEQAQGLQDPVTYQRWTTGVYDLLKRLHDQLREYQAHGYRVIGYGAAAKGMTLINAGHIKLDAVIDDNPLKQGTWCPGTAIPVVSSDYIDQLPADAPVVFVPLAWNFYKEIVGRIQQKRQNSKDIFVRYFPTITSETHD